MTEAIADLAVLGGGPGGAACALAAARAGLSVALFEPQGEAFDKPCGEGILGEGVRALGELGLSSVAAGARPFEGIRYCIPGVEPVRVRLPSAGVALLRPTLMRLLGEAIEREGSIVRWTTRTQASRCEDGFELSTAQGRIARARMLVAADGAGGTSAPWLRGPRRHRAHARDRGRLGLRARFESAHELADVEVHLGSECELYLTPLPDGWINVAALFDVAPRGIHGAARLLERALDQHPLARAQLGLQVGPAEARALDHPLPRRTSDGTSFLVGDAGGGIDPILGCGLAVALRTGIEAARAARARLDGRPRERVRADYERFYAREVRARRALSSFLRAAARHAALARTLARVARASPLLTRALVRIAGD